MNIRFLPCFLSLLMLIAMFPSATFSSTTFRIDMDANSPGLQTDIFVNPGDSFSINVEVVMDSLNDSLSQFGYSVWWDTSELSTPSGSDITTFALGSGWVDASYLSISSPYIYNFFQQNTFNPSSGPLTAVVATIDWTAPSPLTDGSFDILPGFSYFLDGAWDKNISTFTPTFQGGSVHVVPEPVSSTLFIIGGATLGLSRFRKKFKK